ncbi:MAG: hypothetical protein AB9888_00095 [Bacteroidales bacterium]
MTSVEKRLDLLGQPEDEENPVTEDEQCQILALTEKLAEPELNVETRLVIATQIRFVLLGVTKTFATETPAIASNRSIPLEQPPPDLIHSIAA